MPSFLAGVGQLSLLAKNCVLTTAALQHSVKKHSSSIISIIPSNVIAISLWRQRKVKSYSDAVHNIRSACKQTTQYLCSNKTCITLL